MYYNAKVSTSALPAAINQYLNYYNTINKYIKTAFTKFSPTTENQKGKD